MILPTNGVIQQQAILTLIETPPAIVEQLKEPTIEEKIKQNFYKCKETEWIRKDNAMCLPKPVQTVKSTTKTVKPVKQALQSSGNTYTPGQCTYHTKNVLGWVPNGWGNASSWAANAQADGYTLSSVPRVGAVAWRSGHVAAVIGVGNGTVTISEANYDWNGSVRTITIPVGEYSYIF